MVSVIAFTRALHGIMFTLGEPISNFFLKTEETVWLDSVDIPRCTVADLRFDKGGFKSKYACAPTFSRRSPAHFLIEELLEVNEMQVV